MNPAQRHHGPAQGGDSKPVPAGAPPSDAPDRPARVAVIGPTGAGKTTLASRAAALLAVPHVEIDALNWGPHWQEAADGVLRERVDRALSGPAWVVDGNYSRVRDLVWPRADTLVWLDYPFLLVMGRLLLRTIRRVVTREELWGTNRETWQSQFFSRDSLFLWQFRTHWRRRREYRTLVKRPEYAHLRLVRLRSPRAARAWLAALEQATAPAAVR